MPCHLVQLFSCWYFLSRKCFEIFLFAHLNHTCCDASRTNIKLLHNTFYYEEKKTLSTEFKGFLQNFKRFIYIEKNLESNSCLMLVLIKKIKIYENKLDLLNIWKLKHILIILIKNRFHQFNRYFSWFTDIFWLLQWFDNIFKNIFCILIKWIIHNRIKHIN